MKNAQRPKYLWLLKKGCTASNPMGNSGSPKRFFEDGQLGIRASKDRHVFPWRALVMMLAKLSCNPAGLFKVGWVLCDRWKVAVCAVRDERARFAGAQTEHCVGNGKNLRGRSVVVFKTNEATVGKALRKGRKEPWVGPIPCVNGLVGVTHDTQIDRGGNRNLLIKLTQAEPTVE